jgi:hypothetical protein
MNFNSSEIASFIALLLSSVNLFAAVRTIMSAGEKKDRVWIHQQLDWMANMGAIAVVDAGTVKIATLLPAGWAHLRRERFIEGIKKPSPLKQGI